MDDATVVCRVMGCGPAVQALSGAQFGQGSGQIWMDDVRCVGQETLLTQCPHSGFGNHNCGHTKDAGVVCAEICSNYTDLSEPWRNYNFYSFRPKTDTDLTEGWYRFTGIGGEVLSSYCHGNSRTLSLCRGFYLHKLFPTDKTFITGHQTCGPSSCGPNALCVGDGRCECKPGYEIPDGHLPTGDTHQCGVGLRLVGGTTNCSGRVEVLHNGTWGTVCDDGWDINDATVVCRVMGCGPAVQALSGAQFGQGSGQIWMDDVRCVGQETLLTQCSHSGFGNHKCGHTKDAGVVCSEICSNYTNLSEPWRNHNFYRFQPKTDTNITKGLYRFTGIGGDVLSSYCNGDRRILHLCSKPDYSSILEGQVYTLDLCHYSGGCTHSGHTVDVLFCPGGFYLYKLFPTDKTFMTGKTDDYDI
ncbi:deleted in malignant brain tumors 1 protein-like [Sardina pilchardus]|uniref:deleted in malignant brain tumors 1 protein-like n=1 Tax=Sardina pilchardus TaxID=27697 RepID=UPI002E164561